MQNPWLSIPLQDYEGHMGRAGVRQLTGLSELFEYVLDGCLPESVALLGVAGGNGLEQIDSAMTTRVVGVDINQCYLDEVRQRFGMLAGLELYCRDLTTEKLDIAPVALVHAALLFEHTGLGLPLRNASSLVGSGGRLSVVLQLPSEQEHGVAPTGYTSMQTLKRDFQLIDPASLQRQLEQEEFLLVEQKSLPLAGGKAFWLGVFARRER